MFRVVLKNGCSGLNEIPLGSSSCYMYQMEWYRNPWLFATCGPSVGRVTPPWSKSEVPHVARQSWISLTNTRRAQAKDRHGGNDRAWHR